jgi:predicted naringenin-chalcone synthase
MQILKLATALPENEFSTEDLLETFPCRLTEGVRQNVLNLGVHKRSLLNCLAPSDPETIMSEADLIGLCKHACAEAIEKAQLSTGDVGYFIAAYDANPFLSPGLSQILVRELGFDPYIHHVNAQGIASTAFPKALELASDYLAAHPDSNALICVSGVSSYWFQHQVHELEAVMEIGDISKLKDPPRKAAELRKWVATMEFFLFGDGVCAAVVSNNRGGLSVKRIVEVTNLRKKDYLAGYARLASSGEPFRFGFYSHLDKEIPTLGIEYTELALKRLLGANTESLRKTARKWVIHTGSQKILNLLAEHNGIEGGKIAESCSVLREHGNLAGASLPFILEKVLSGTNLSKGDKILMLGYGWGFSAAACLLEQ